MRPLMPWHAMNHDTERFLAHARADRAGARKSGREGGEVRLVKPEDRVDHMPHTQPYPVEDVLVDLLEVSSGGAGRECVIGVEGLRSGVGWSGVGWRLFLRRRLRAYRRGKWCPLGQRRDNEYPSPEMTPHRMLQKPSKIFDSS